MTQGVFGLGAVSGGRGRTPRRYQARPAARPMLLLAADRIRTAEFGPGPRRVPSDLGSGDSSGGRR
jgi:hypothetical protein